jgi:hypothetical protein
MSDYENLLSALADPNKFARDFWDWINPNGTISPNYDILGQQERFGILISALKEVSARNYIPGHPDYRL